MRLHPPPQPILAGSRAARVRRRAACRHSSNCLSAALQGLRGFPFPETLAAAVPGATVGERSGRGTMPNQALSFGDRRTIWGIARKMCENRHFRSFLMQDHTSPPSLENAIALQKYGVGQPVRRKEDDTLVRGKGKYTDDFSLPGQAYAWIVRSSHAHGIIRGIDTSAAKAMPGVLGVWTGADLASANYRPIHLRAAAEKSRRLAAAADQPFGAEQRQGALCRRPRGLCGGRDARTSARRR